MDSDDNGRVGLDVVGNLLRSESGDEREEGEKSHIDIHLRTAGTVSKVGNLLQRRCSGRGGQASRSKEETRE